MENVVERRFWFDDDLLNGLCEIYDECEDKEHSFEKMIGWVLTILEITAKEMKGTCTISPYGCLGRTLFCKWEIIRCDIDQGYDYYFFDRTYEEKKYMNFIGKETGYEIIVCITREERI